MISFFRRLSGLGIDPQFSSQQSRQISSLNTIVALVLLLIVLNIAFTFAATDLTTGRQLLIGVLVVHWMMIVLTLVFNYLKKYTVARIYFCFVAASFMTIYTLLLGPETRWSFFLPIIIFLQFYIFPPREKKWLYAIGAYCSFCFIGIELWFKHHGALEYYPTEFLLLFKYFNSFGILFCAGAMGVSGYNAINTAEKKLSEEHQRSERLLLNILPVSIARRLKENPGIIADSYSDVTVLFADIVDFTKLTVHVSPHKLIEILNNVFSKFDELADKFGLEKIKTIGDAYMVVAGLPEARADHAETMAAMGVAMLEAVEELNASQEFKLNVRVGICSGPVMAGVIGKRKFSYDLWGDCVNTAARMESHGVAGQIQVSESTFQLLKNKYSFDRRGMIDIKGKGLMQTYLLRSKN